MVLYFSSSLWYFWHGFNWSLFCLHCLLAHPFRVLFSYSPSFVWRGSLFTSFFSLKKIFIHPFLSLMRVDKTITSLLLLLESTNTGELLTYLVIYILRRLLTLLNLFGFVPLLASFYASASSSLFIVELCLLFRFSVSTSSDIFYWLFWTLFPDTSLSFPSLYCLEYPYIQLFYEQNSLLSSEK